MLKKILLLSTAGMLAAFLLTSCAPSAPEFQPEPEPEVKPAPPPPSGFIMKPFQEQMSSRMEKSFELADEVIVGVFSQIFEDKDYGSSYYFEDFRSFDKIQLSWGPIMSVIAQVLPDKLKPEIIKRKEFKDLNQFDKVGICWDVYQEQRNIFLVEGEINLLFVTVGYDEANNRSYRNLIDAYPVTKDCEAKKVFDFMIYQRTIQK